jgi:hypothetical protein
VHPALVFGLDGGCKASIRRGQDRMHLQTILHRVERHKGFGYGKVVFREAADGPVLEVAVRPRSNSRPRCSGCGQAGPGYDRLPERRSAFVPLWGLAVSFVYPPRRVACPRCGIKVERLPWAEGKSRLTTTYQWFLARGYPNRLQAAPGWRGLLFNPRHRRMRGPWLTILPDLTAVPTLAKSNNAFAAKPTAFSRVNESVAKTS